MEEGESIGILVSFQGGVVHQASDGKVRHHEAEELLAHEIRCLAAQDDPGAPQMSPELVEGGLDLPALVIEGCQFPALGLPGDRGWW